MCRLPPDTGFSYRRRRGEDDQSESVEDDRNGIIFADPGNRNRCLPFIVLQRFFFFAEDVGYFQREREFFGDAGAVPGRKKPFFSQKNPGDDKKNKYFFSFRLEKYSKWM